MNFDDIDFEDLLNKVLENIEIAQLSQNQTFDDIFDEIYKVWEIYKNLGVFVFSHHDFEDVGSSVYKISLYTINWSFAVVTNK